MNSIKKIKKTFFPPKVDIDAVDLSEFEIELATEIFGMVKMVKLIIIAIFAIDICNIYNNKIPDNKI